MQIFIKILHRDTPIVIQVEQTDTIITVKELIKEILQLPIKVQRLIYESNLLENTQSLKDIPPESTLYLIYTVFRPEFSSYNVSSS